jgi:DNA-binding MarR family transcriptional regulator
MSLEDCRRPCICAAESPSSTIGIWLPPGPQYGILARLKRQGPMSINTLAAELVVDRATLGRNIRPLERDDLIAIEADPSDGRSKILRLTKAGDARFQRAEIRWAEAQRHFEYVYGGKRASQLREKLRAVVASELGPFDTTAAQ